MSQPPENQPPENQPPSPPPSDGPPPAQPAWPAGPPAPAPWPAQPGPPVPPHSPGTNGFAIAALVLGIIGGCLLGFIFGFLALRQIKKSGQDGRGMAIAGIILSALWLVVAIVVGIIAATTGADRDENGQISDSGRVWSNQVRVGDCVNGLVETTRLRSLEGVPCSEPHEAQAYAEIRLPGGAFPGLTAIEERANEQCGPRMRSVAPKAWRDRKVEVFYLHPTAESWKLGDHTIICLTYTEKPRTGSILD